MDYDVTLRDFKLSDGLKYNIDGDYSFFNKNNKMCITCVKPTSNKNHPSCLLHAFDLLYPKRVISAFCKDDGYQAVWESRILYSYYTDELYNDETVTEIDKKSLEEIETWYKKLIEVNKNLREKTNWNYAYNEFCTSLNTSSIEINYLHLTSILETLFNKDNSELVYRISLNTAFFLGSNAEERKRIFNSVKHAYNIRSKTTHGDVKNLLKALGSQSTFQDFFEFREIVVNALRYTHGREKDEVLKEIEEKIFS